VSGLELANTINAQMTTMPCNNSSAQISRNKYQLHSDMEMSKKRQALLHQCKDKLTMISQKSAFCGPQK